MYSTLLLLQTPAAAAAAAAAAAGLGIVGTEKGQRKEMMKGALRVGRPQIHALSLERALRAYSVS